MKLIFLDMDGPINTVGSILTRGQAYPFRPETWGNMCPIAKGLLQKLVAESGARVVLSSSWRRDKEWVFLSEFFRFPITSLLQAEVARGQAILNVVNDPTVIGLSNEEVESWVSLDDMYMDELKDMPQQILIDPNRGFDADYFYQAWEVLNIEKGAPIVFV